MPQAPPRLVADRSLNASQAERLSLPGSLGEFVAHVVSTTGCGSGRS